MIGRGRAEFAAGQDGGGGRGAPRSAMKWSGDASGDDGDGSRREEKKVGRRSGRDEKAGEMRRRRNGGGVGEGGRGGGRRAEEVRQTRMSGGRKRIFARSVGRENREERSRRRLCSEKERPRVGAGVEDVGEGDWGGSGRKT
ncbi:hypothetical protein Tco_0261207 [Tanacetum coccineum]